MSLTRRGFLGTLLAAATAAALPKDVLWLPAADSPLPPVQPDALLGLEQLVTNVAKELQRIYPGTFLRPTELEASGARRSAPAELGRMVKVRLPEKLEVGPLPLRGPFLPTARAVTLHTQSSVMWPMPWEVGPAGLQIPSVGAAADCLRDHLRKHGCGYSASMAYVPVALPADTPYPVQVVMTQPRDEDGWAVRGVLAWEPGFEQRMIRLDVLAGS